MNKEKLERIFRNGGAAPVAREQLGDYELYIGDGFSLPPHNAYRRFGVDDGEFPKGMYVTWWWIGKDEKLDTGQPLFFDAFHDPDYSIGDKRTGRINKARQTAQEFLAQRKKHAKAH